jgi:hypothetical protein
VTPLEWSEYERHLLMTLVIIYDCKMLIIRALGFYKICFETSKVKELTTHPFFIGVKFSCHFL